ncbi:hypothetical protein [Paraburkholderia ferrariae]|uniref:hypothetical protein n=1 Tax=Paraburkholderia ferrariae TaxID=386056 RepID=UPI000480BE19|nr:hypothetical protein [Paraburkholderia ferrariae]
MKPSCFAAVLVVFLAGCASSWPPATTQAANAGPAQTDTYLLHGINPPASAPPRLTVGTSYPDTQLILPWFLNDIIDFVNYH